MQTILHLDIDAFFASIEQLKNPRLRGRPVIVGTGVIASCSYEARRFGLKAAMPIRQAVRICPDVVVLDGNQHTYRCFTDAIWEIARRWLPAMETFLDEAYGDLSGTDQLYPDPLVVGRTLKLAIKEEVGLNVTIGIGGNRMVAKMAGKSVKPDGLAFVPHGQEDAFIATRPIEQLPGVGPATAPILREMNLHTIADLRVLRLEVLEALFGRNGVHLYERCRGRDTRPIHEREIPKSISRETSLHKPTCDAAELRAYLQYLAERAMRTIRQLGLATRGVRVNIRHEDGESAEAGQVLPSPTMIDEEVLPLARELFDRIVRRRVALTRVGVVFTHFSAPDGQQDLFAIERNARLERLHAALDHIRTKFGHASVVAGASISLIGKLQQEANGYVLRTPSLTK